MTPIINIGAFNLNYETVLLVHAHLYNSERESSIVVSFFNQPVIGIALFDDTKY